jgi:hypothetical protein
MKTLYQSLLFTIAALALAGTAYGQVPSTNDTSDKNGNTGMGTNALGGPLATNSGLFNTGVGVLALGAITTNGQYNTAVGWGALSLSSTGQRNTAIGMFALANSDYGNDNTAVGLGALYGDPNSDSTGSNNTAIGVNALSSYVTGSNNTASGYRALYSNTTGGTNTATGGYSLYSSATGGGNTASGYKTLYSNTTGTENAAFGQGALYSSTTGSNNVALGFQAGLHLTTGSHNIDIGNFGVAAENGVIRIGTSQPNPLQTATYIAGIYGTSVSGSAVVVSSTGQLGVVVSSERFKTAIAPMGSNIAKLAQLRPVTFRLKTDPKGARQYGLIAEEVAKVFPELVIRGKKGRIDGVRYDELAPMLLNEMQKQAAKMRDLEQQVAELKDLKQQMAVMSAALQDLQSKDVIVARR